MNFILFYLFLETGEPMLHKPSGFFWAPLQPYDSYKLCILVLYYILAK